MALGSDLAEAVLTGDRSTAVAALAQRAHKLLGMSHEQFNEVVSRVLKLIPETEELYETSIIEAEDAENLLAEARELLAVRNLHALQEVSALQATTSVLLARTEEAEDSNSSRCTDRRPESTLARSDAPSRIYTGSRVRP